MSTRVIHDTGGLFSQGDVTDRPAPTILFSNQSLHVLTDDTPERTLLKAKNSKPPYRVPLMTEIADIPWNGFNVVSTFSGCGGSCLGYRMAGFRVVWANEFVPIAQESYRANASKASILDGRDIRHVQPEEILAATGLKQGELDLFDGSPPCQAFSTAGKREKGWGKTKTYEHGAKQCNETLFDEYVRLLRGLMPKVFVAENVSGLVKGTAKGWFLDVLKALKESGYRVKAKLLDAQWLGVPQMRQRIIFVGVREDLGLEPVHPGPLAYRYSVRDALPWINTVVQNDCYGEGARICSNTPSPSIAATGIGAKRISQTYVADPTEHSVITARSGSHFKEIECNRDRPMNSIAANGQMMRVQVTTGAERRKFTIAELKRICAFPDDFELKGTYAQQWERLGNAVPPVMMRAIAESIRDGVLRKTIA